MNVDADGLTAQQAAFCREYLVDGIASKAAVRAGYSPAGSRAQSSLLLTKPNIQSVINRLKAERAVRTETESDWVLRRLKIEAELETSRHNSSSRLKALELIGKHHKMFTDKTEVSGSLTLYVDSGVPDAER